jgi:DNA-binding NarL/FixJ family response regulator
MPEKVRVRNPNLTDTEAKALQLAANGFLYHDCAKQLGVSAQHLKRVWSSASRKLGADNVRHAVAQGIRRGVIQ